MFRQRALITLTIGPLMIWLIYLGGLFYLIPVTVALFVASWEFVTIVNRMGRRLSLGVMVFVVSLQLLAAAWLPELTSFMMFVGMVILMFYGLWLYETKPGGSATADWMAMIGGMMLIGWVGGHFLRLRQLPELSSGLVWQWSILTIAGTWAADSFAYMVGKFVAGNFVLGKHYMTPRLSPNKTWEGYLGGIIIGSAFVLSIGLLVFKLPVLPVVLLALLVSGVSPAGDVAMSLLKREGKVKDSSNIFPGHGGVLDRIDSLMWSVTFIYYLLLWIG